MNLSNKISEDDRQRVHDIRNHPQYDTEFSSENSGDDDFGGLFGDDSGGGDSMDDLFGGDDDFGFGGDSSNPFGGSSDTFGGSNDPFGGGSNDPFGSSNDPFGGGSGFSGGSGLGVNTSPFGSQPGAQPGAEQPDMMDKAIDASIDTAKTVGEILVELVNSLKLRNIDDFGFLSRNSIIVGVGTLGLGLLGLIVGTTGGMGGSLLDLSKQIMLCGGLLSSTGIIGIGTSALVLEKVGSKDVGTVEDIPDVPSGDDNFTQEYEDNIGDELDDLFADDFDLDGDEDEDSSDFSSGDDDMLGNDDIDDMSEEEEEFEPDDEVDFSSVIGEKLEEIPENQVISRQTLFNTFLPLFPNCTPKFADVKEIDKDSEDFSTLETICLKAMSNLANMQLEEINSHLESAKETFFSYELRVKRINKIKKTEDLAREVEVYMRDDGDDDGVNATVSIEGDFFKIIVTKGVSAIVTFGDVFKHDYCREFFLNSKNKLPVILGIDELGNVILGEGKNYDTALIAGKPRSGKSWYVLSILMCLMLFNTPEDVQFIIIDPKESNLFKTMALMPHVAGLHNDEHILEILDDIINNEAPRRKQLLADNRVDDIWGLRKKGVKLPVLYVIIDEYITVINNLKSSDDKDAFKEFNTKIQTLISQLPSLGIRLLFVPHRATGIVDKTNRTMIQLSACVRSEVAEVKDTLDVTKWDRALTRPGDIALKSSDMKKPAFVRGAALTTDDADNAIFMETAAKAFYKMGVELPDMSTMRVAVNRDEDYIKRELGGQNIVQYNAQEMENAAHSNMILNSNNSIDKDDDILDFGDTDDTFDDSIVDENAEQEGLEDSLLDDEDDFDPDVDF